MAKAVYVGVGSKAHKMKKAYIGIGGKARKVKKMYIGVGGKARLCYSAEADKFGTATPLSKYRSVLAGTTVGGYALFGGGGYDSDARKGEAIMDAYNASLTRTTAASLSVARQGLTAITLGNHALFVGGRSGDTSFGTVDVYDASLTRTTATELSVDRYDSAAAVVGSYALFAGGRRKQNSLFVFAKDAVDAYNTSLTRTTATPLPSNVYACAGGTVGGYAVFSGGSSMNSDSTLVEAIGSMAMVCVYDSSLTSSQAASLSCPRAVHSAATIGNHLLFAGGYNRTTGKYLSTVESYDASLTRSTAVELSSAKNGLASATVGEYAMFAGGYKGNSDAAYVATVDAYNTALTKTTMPDLSVGRHGLASAVIGDYALFAGGISKISSTTDKYQDVVDVYSA